LAEVRVRIGREVVGDIVESFERESAMVAIFEIGVKLGIVVGKAAGGGALWVLLLWWQAWTRSLWLWRVLGAHEGRTIRA